MKEFTKIQNFNLIDFTSVEFPSDIDATLHPCDMPSPTYRELKRLLGRLKWNMDFKTWFAFNLCIYDNYIFVKFRSDKELLSLVYLLKKVEDSNPTLKETIRIWREDESQLPSGQKFLIESILNIYYQDLFAPSDYVYRRGLWYEEMIDNFIEDYKPRVINVGDSLQIRKENFSTFLHDLRHKTAMNVLNNKNFGFGLKTYAFLGTLQYVFTEEDLTDYYRDLEEKYWESYPDLKESYLKRLGMKTFG